MATAIGHSGYTGPGYIGPTGIPGAVGATGPGPGTVGVESSNLALRPQRPGDGLHQHAELVTTKPHPDYLSVTPVHVSILGTPLEVIVFWLAVWGLLAAGSAVAWTVLRSRAFSAQLYDRQSDTHWKAASQDRTGDRTARPFPASPTHLTHGTMRVSA